MDFDFIVVEVDCDCEWSVGVGCECYCCWCGGEFGKFVRGFVRVVDDALNFYFFVLFCCGE